MFEEKNSTESEIENFLFEIVLISIISILLFPIIMILVMLGHEGGHGIVVVPAIILNLELPLKITENMNNNPFTNFPLGIFSLLLSFPLGVLANILMFYLSYKLLLDLKNDKKINSKIFINQLIIFCLLNLKGIFNNLLGSDFSIIFVDLLHLPMKNPLITFMIQLFVFIIFPVILFIKKVDPIFISLTALLTFILNNLFSEIIVPIIAPILMEFFWWLFIIGLIVFISIVIGLKFSLKRNQHSLKI